MPTLYFGGGTLGEGNFSSEASIKPLLDVLQKNGISCLDTAPVYTGSAPGSSERLLGAAGAAARGFTIDTKIKVTGEGPGKGSLTGEAIDRSLGTSLGALGEGAINTLYCHIPDPATPMAETAAALHQQWTQGRFKHLGLSNYKPQQVSAYLSICDDNNWVKPSVYQGQYNAVCRGMETELLPLLRRHGLAYIAFSPLAGGFLTGKLSLGADITGTRFEDGNMMGAHYRPMYDKTAMHAAIKDLHTFLEPRGLSMAGASLRWLYYHSALGDDDGITLGATKVEQIEVNVEEIRKGRLEGDVIEAFEKAWEAVRGVAP